MKSGYLATDQQSLSSWTAITNGGFLVTIDGTPYSIGGIDLSSATTMQQVASLILAQMGSYANLKFYNNQFVMSSTTASTETSSVGFLSAPVSGTDLSSLMRMTDVTGATQQAGDTNFIPYVTLLGTDLGLTPTNHAVSGGTSFDQAGPIYATSVSATDYQLFTYAIGTNDFFSEGAALAIPGKPYSAASAQYQSGLEAEYAFLALPDPARIKANTICTGIGWSASSLQDWNFGTVSTTNGSACTAEVYGSTAYVGYTINGAPGAAPNYNGTATVCVTDVTPVVCKTITTAPAVTTTTGYVISLSQKGQTYGPQVARLSGLPMGTHQVTVTVTSSTAASNPVYIDWFGANGAVLNAGGPQLLAGGIIREGIGSPYNDTITGWWDGLNRNAVADLRADGLPVQYVDSRSAQGDAQINTFLNTDLIHPNQAGHARIASAFLQRLDTFAVTASSPALTLSAPATPITMDQPLPLSVLVSGGNDLPSGTVWTLTNGSSSPTATLNQGSASLVIPAGSLQKGTNTLAVYYTPDTASYPIYNSSVGSLSVQVIDSSPTVTVTASSSSITTMQALSVGVAVSGETGSPTPTGTVTLTGDGYTSPSTSLSGGAASINIPAGSLADGRDTITASYSGDGNFSASTGVATVTVTAAVSPSFSIAGTTVSLTPGAVSGNTSTVTVTQVGGFTGTVSLTAAFAASPSVAQYLPTLSFGSTSPVSLNGTAAETATLTISTTAATSAAVVTPKWPGVPWYAAGGATLAGLLLVGIPARRRRWQTLTGLLMLMVALAGGVLACGGGGGSVGSAGGGGTAGTTAGVYKITVTGISGSTTETGTITLNVQ